MLPFLLLFLCGEVRCPDTAPKSRIMGKLCVFFRGLQNLFLICYTAQESLQGMQPKEDPVICLYDALCRSVFFASTIHFANGMLFWKVGKGKLMKKWKSGMDDTRGQHNPFEFRILFHALITYLATSCQLRLHPMVNYWGLWGAKAVFWNLLQSFEAFSFTRLLLLPGLFLIYRAISRAWDRSREKDAHVKCRLGLSIHIPAILFAVMMVLGASFAEYNAWREVLTIENGQLIKCLLVFWGFYLLFRYLIQFIYVIFDAGFGRLHAYAPRKSKVFRWYRDKLLKAPFRTAALTLLILYLPLMIISYPGIIGADTVGQTLIGFPELAEPYVTTDVSQLGKPGAHLNNHHPVAHTMLLHLCLVAGKAVLHSWNAGFYLYSILQELAVICVISFLIREYIRKYGVSFWYVAGVLLYIFASPLIHNYIILNTKDVYYALFLLLTVYFCHQLLTCGGKRELLFLLLSATGTILFRNEGQYVLLMASVGFLFLNRKTRKRFTVVLLYIILFSAGYFHLLLPALGIAPGSRREMFSIPFQQTARYVSEHGDQVTAEERETIDRVLNYEKIAQEYDPILSDNIKDQYREESATPEALLQYLRCWFKMGLKQPETYLAAFVNFKYEYFYPGHRLLELDDYRRTGFLFSWLTELAEKVGIAPAQPAVLYDIQGFADDARLSLSQFSPLSFFLLSSLYPFFVILFLCYSLRKKDRIMLSMSLIPFIVLLVCLAGPTNGSYSRYTFPLALLWPFFDPILRPRKACEHVARRNPATWGKT